MTTGADIETAGPVGGDERRRQLIERAAELFNEAGYHQTSVEDVAEACGIRKPTLYHYFSGKDEILHSIHDEFITVLLTKQEEREQAGGSAADAIYEAMRDVLELMGTHPGYVRVFFEHQRDLNEASRAEIGEKHTRYQASVERLFVRGAEAGEFRPVDARLASLVLSGMCNWAYHWYQPDGPLSGEEIARTFSAILVDGLEGDR